MAYDNNSDLDEIKNMGESNLVLIDAAKPNIYFSIKKARSIEHRFYLGRPGFFVEIDYYHGNKHKYPWDEEGSGGYSLNGLKLIYDYGQAAFMKGYITQIQMDSLTLILSDYAKIADKIDEIGGSSFYIDIPAVVTLEPNLREDYIKYADVFCSQEQFYDFTDTFTKKYNLYIELKEVKEKLKSEILKLPSLNKVAFHKKDKFKEQIFMIEDALACLENTVTAQEEAILFKTMEAFEKIKPEFINKKLNNFKNLKILEMPSQLYNNLKALVFCENLESFEDAYIVCRYMRANQSIGFIKKNNIDFSRATEQDVIITQNAQEINHIFFDAFSANLLVDTNRYSFHKDLFLSHYKFGKLISYKPLDKKSIKEANFFNSLIEKTKLENSLNFANSQNKNLIEKI